MCGRMTLVLDAKSIEEILEDIFHIVNPADVTQPGFLAPQYNIAPSHPLLSVIETKDKERRGGYLTWGFKPSWAKDAFNPLINSRSETITEKPMFKSAFSQKRCIILADSFYEWDKKHDNQPYRFLLKDQKFIPLAGIYTSYKGPDNQTIYGCSVLTCPPNELMAPIHQRMPVILSPDAIDSWLSLDSSETRLKDLLMPYNHQLMTKYPVSSHVNSVKNQDSRCIEPLAV